MPEIVCIDNENGVILVNSFDLVGVVDLSKSLDSVAQVARQQNLHKVIIDATNMDMLPSTIHLYCFASELSKQTSDMKYAVIVSEKSAKEVRYLEIFARSRGVDIHIFTSQDEALKWS